LSREEFSFLTIVILDCGIALRGEAVEEAEEHCFLCDVLRSSNGPQGQLRENRNLSLSIRAKAVLIYVLSVPVHNVNKLLQKNFGFFVVMCESTA
jgi:hypothetical protein